MTFQRSMKRNCRYFRWRTYDFAKEHKTTPAAFFMAALASAIGRSHEVGKKEHIVCMLPANLRTVYNANVCRKH